MTALEGQVALITGAARGQGRSHAVRLAGLGADIVALDLCAQIDSVPYGMSTPDDLEETARQVRHLGRRVVAAQADVRDANGLAKVVAEALGRLGRLDIVIANAGIAPVATTADPQQVWQDVIDVNLTGVWNTVRACAEPIIAGGRGGAIVITSSTAGLKGAYYGDVGVVAYSAAKHGLVGLMRGFARDFARHSIRVNTIHPTAVNTPMVVNESWGKFLQAAPEAMAAGNALPVEMLEPSDISDAVAFLVTDSGRWVTGVTLPIDAGFTML